MQRTRSIQIYLKPEIEEDAILLDVWQLCRRRSRPQVVFRRMLQEGLRSLIDQGAMPPSIVREIADHPLLGDDYPVKKIPEVRQERSRLAAHGIARDRMISRKEARAGEGRPDDEKSASATGREAADQMTPAVGADEDRADDRRPPLEEQQDTKEGQGASTTDEEKAPSGSDQQTKEETNTAPQLESDDAGRDEKSSDESSGARKRSGRRLHPIM